MKSVSQNTEIHTQLRELIEKLEIAPRENAKLNLAAWIRLSDDINFAAELNQEDMETLTTKIMSAFKDSGLSVMARFVAGIQSTTKMCLKSSHTMLLCHLILVCQSLSMSTQGLHSPTLEMLEPTLLSLRST